MRLNRFILWAVVCTGVLGLLFLVFMALRQIDRDFHRVAPGESAAVAWIAANGGTLRKEGEQGHVVWVNLAGTSVTDSELGRLNELTRIRGIDLSGTMITDAGLRVLGPLKELEYIDVSSTHVTPDGFRIFLSQHPRAREWEDGSNE